MGRFIDPDRLRYADCMSVKRSDYVILMASRVAEKDAGEFGWLMDIDEVPSSDEMLDLIDQHALMSHDMYPAFAWEYGQGNYGEAV